MVGWKKGGGGVKFIQTNLSGVLLIQPAMFQDRRGFFFESYRKDLFDRNGISMEFVQDNHSRSARGVLRGLHYQTGPRAQAKLMYVVKGAVFDVVVDVRKSSKNFGKYLCTTLSAENKTMIYVPTGFAHGFCSLEDGTEFIYKASNYYSPKNEHGILWNDPALAIPWPKLDIPYVLSERDRKNPPLLQ